MDTLSLFGRQEKNALQGPPYASNVSTLGGVPTVHIDVPITAVFLFLFAVGAVCHMRIYTLNKKRGHKFLISGFLFAFCMARVTTCTMRIVWATRASNVSISLAASIFVTAGVVLVYIINLVLAQRILRALHPQSCWSPLFNYCFVAVYALIVISLFLLIAFTVQSFYTLDAHKHEVARDVQLYGGTLISVVSFLPIPLLLCGLITARQIPMENFGKGRFPSKVWILLFTAALLSFGAWFRAGTNYLPPKPLNNPAWYQSRACFYVFSFSVEVTVVWLYIISRIDKRFYVPDGSKGPGDYSGTGKSDEERQIEEITSGINTEKEDYSGMPAQEPRDIGCKASNAETISR